MTAVRIRKVAGLSMNHRLTDIAGESRLGQVGRTAIKTIRD